MNRTCPQCFGTIPSESEFCPKCGPSKQVRKHKSYKQRKQEETGYSKLFTSEYKKQRQVVLEMTQGRCFDCGQQIAYKREGSWVCVPGSGVHHIVKRSADQDNASSKALIPLCRKCHYRHDH